MALQQATVHQLMRWFSTDQVDWDAAYADQLPRIYNYFRFRLGSDTDVKELTSRTFEKAWRGRERYRGGMGTFLISGHSPTYSQTSHLAVDIGFCHATDGTSHCGL